MTESNPRWKFGIKKLSIAIAHTAEMTKETTKPKKKALRTNFTFNNSLFTQNNKGSMIKGIVMETFSIPAIKFSELNRPKSRNTCKMIKNPIDFVFLKTFINSLLEYPPTNR